MLTNFESWLTCVLNSFSCNFDQWSNQTWMLLLNFFSEVSACRACHSSLLASLKFSTIFFLILSLLVFFSDFFSCKRFCLLDECNYLLVLANPHSIVWDVSWLLRKKSASNPRCHRYLAFCEAHKRVKNVCNGNKYLSIKVWRMIIENHHWRGLSISSVLSDSC